MQKIVHHIVRIQRRSYPTLQRLLQTGQLHRDTEQLQHNRFEGLLYRPASEILAHQTPLSDSRFQLGEQVIEAELHRLPSAEYLSLMNRPGVESPTDLNALSRALRVTSSAPQARQLLQRVHPYSGDTRLALQLVAPTRFQAAWLPHRTRLARKKSELFLVLFFNLGVTDVDQQLMNSDISIDIGQSPVLTAYVINTNRDIQVNSPVPGHLRQLMCQLMGDERQLLGRILQAWHRARLEQFLDRLTLTARLVFVEELSYKDLDTKFLRSAREYSILDWHESWLHQRLQVCHIPYERVWPNGTSQRCHRCPENPYGHRVGSVFHCPTCGLTTDAHQNAVRNIAARGYKKRARMALNYS